MRAGWFGLPFWAYAAACALISLGWSRRPPRHVSATGHLRGFALRWGHALTWALLCLACVGWAVGQDAVGHSLALGALVVYVGHLWSLLTSRRRLG